MSDDIVDVDGPFFMGCFTPRLDDKGRLILPAKFRGQLASGLVMTPGQERCLYVYTMADFRRTYGQSRVVPGEQTKEERDYDRLMMAGAHDEIPDKQGRVCIPAKLRTYAGLTRDVAVMGVKAHLQIWDAATWDAYSAEQESAYANVSKAVVPGVV